MTIAGFGALTVLVCVAAPLIGATSIHLSRVFDRTIPFADNVDAQIFFIARLPRVLAGAVVGAMLASAGVVLQALLRNPLADPFTLGVSAGASVGAMLAIVFGAAIALGPVSPVPMASLAGALLASLVVFLVSAQIESSHTLDLNGFVDKASIDQVYLDTPYYVSPADKVSEEAFASL